MRSKLLERTSLGAIPDTVLKTTASLNTWGTNAIEGSTITRKDAEKILVDEITPGNRPVRDVIETILHERTFRDIVREGRRDIELKTVLEYHESVFGSVLPDAGMWRRVNVRIRGVRHSPPRMEKIVPEMENWIDEYRQRDIEGEDVFTLAAWMHYGFERIHPFSDGNGRVGRLLLNKHFLNRNWPPVHILPEHRDEYPDCLADASGGDLSGLEAFLMKLSASSLLDLLDRLGTKKDKLISLKKASALTGYSEKYLALRCQQGELPALREGREWRTSQFALELYSKHKGR